MSMDIDELRAFLSIAQLGGFTRAAARLHRSQPAISRRIALLEQELGAPLLERVRARAALTEAGRVFLPYAEAVIATLQDGRDAVRALSEEPRGAVSLALVGTLADTHLVAVLKRFARKFNDVRLDLRTASSREVSGLVRRGEVTLGLRYFADPSPDLVSHAVGAEAMLVVCASRHRLARAEPVRVGELRGEKWVGFSVTRAQPESFGSVLERLLVTAGLDGAEITTIDSLTAQKRLVEAGFGIALMPESSVREELRLGTLKALRVAKLATAVPITAIHRRSAYLSAAARAMLSALIDASGRQDSRRRDRGSAG